MKYLGGSVWNSSCLKAANRFSGISHLVAKQLKVIDGHRNHEIVKNSFLKREQLMSTYSFKGILQNR